jgi:hypothetical protein
MVYLYASIDLVYDGCKLDFTQQDIINGGWQKKITLLVLSVESSNDGDDNNDDIVAIGYTHRMVFALKARKIVSKSKWQLNTVTTKNAMKTWLRWLNTRRTALAESIARTREFRQVHGKKWKKG